MSNTSEVLKELIEREILGKLLSVREIARRAGVSYQVLYGILNNKVRNPQIKTVTKLADYFGVTREQLLRGETRKLAEEKSIEELLEISLASLVKNFRYAIGGREPRDREDIDGGGEDFLKGYIHDGVLVLQVGEYEDLSPLMAEVIRVLIKVADIKKAREKTEVPEKD